MRRALVFGLAAAALLPLAAAAREVPLGSGEQVLRDAAVGLKSAAALGLGSGADSEWLAQINADPTMSAAVGAEAALKAQVNSGVAAEPGDPVSEAQRRWPPPDVFHRKAWELEYLTGFFRSPIIVQHPRTTYMLPEIVRVGMMWGSPNPERRFRGSFEGLLELDCLPITSGPGSIIIGGSGLIRYNFSFLDRRFIPYVQSGGGGVCTDAYGFPNSALGTGFNFIINFALGGHFFLSRHWALTTELDYYHMSNAGISKGNFGLNILATTAGVTYFIGR